MCCYCYQKKDLSIAICFLSHNIHFNLALNHNQIHTLKLCHYYVIDRYIKTIDIFSRLVYVQIKHANREILEREQRVWLIIIIGQYYELGNILYFSDRIFFITFIIAFSKLNFFHVLNDKGSVLELRNDGYIRYKTPAFLFFVPF